MFLRVRCPRHTHRYVSFDGIHIALQQDFAYTTTWAQDWTAKQTTVTTHDLLRNVSFDTVYTYAPSIDPNSSTGSTGRVAVEQSIVYKDFNGTVLRTIAKARFDPSLLGCELRQLDSSHTSGEFYKYSATGGQLTDKREYDFGILALSACSYNAAQIPPITTPSATPTRETVISYASFSATPAYPYPSIFDEPSSIISYGLGVRAAETDFAYDQTPVSGVSPPPTGHDEANYGPAFNTRGNTTTVTRQCFPSCGNQITIFTYDNTGNAITSKDPKGNLTQFSHADSYTTGTPPGNTNTYLTAITRPVVNGVSHIDTFSYAYADGQVTVSKDQNLKQITYFYNDSLRRLTESDFPDGGQETISYNDSPPNPSITTSKKITAALSLTSVGTMDGIGHIIKTQLTSDPDGIDITDTTLDGLGHVWKKSNPYRSAGESTYGTTTNYFDAIGRPCLIVPPDGTAPSGSSCPTTAPANDIFTSYSANCSTVSDQAGIARKSCADALGRLSSVSEDPSGLNYLTSYGYDALDNLTSVVQVGSRQRTFTYNPLSQLLSATNPESGVITYVYDAARNVISKTSPAPNQTGSSTVTLSYCYDALNRLTAKAYSLQTCTNGTLASPAATYLYDQTSYNSLTITNGIGRRTGMTDAAGAEAWSYDSMSRPLSDQRTTNGLSRLASYTYYVDGSTQSAGFSGGRIVGYTPGGAGRPLSATINGGTVLEAAHYTPGGSLCYFQGDWNYNWRFTNTFNNRLQPVTMQAINQFPGGTPPPICGIAPIQSGSCCASFLDLTYSYTDASGHNNGNVLSVTNNLNSTRSLAYTYDSLNRVTTARTISTTNLSKCWGEQYSYDAWGNLLSIKGIQPAYNGCVQESGFDFTNFMGANNRITDPAYSYDAAGNMTSRPPVGTLYSYDAENHLVSASGVSYTYDGDGKRVMKSTGTVYWYGAGSNVLTESNFSNAEIASYTYFYGKRIARTDYSNQTVFFLTDHLGSTHYLTSNAGDPGNGTVYDTDYYPFGAERLTSGGGPPNGYKFTGKERDAESGLDNFGARYYGSSLGRFMQTDPIWVKGDRMLDPQRLNLYSYVRNNPLKLTDPSGMDVVLRTCSGSATMTQCFAQVQNGLKKERSKPCPFS